MMRWTYADIWESIALAQPDQPALIQGNECLNWRDLDAQANATAAFLGNAGLKNGSKLGIYMPNAPEYVVAFYAAMKVSIAPFNVNYRYGPVEVTALLSDADTEAVIFDAIFLPLVNSIRRDLPCVRLWIVANCGDGGPPDWATDFTDVVSGYASRNVGVGSRSGNDLIIIYTGGTTGQPKGVMWYQQDLLGVSNYGANVPLGLPPLDSPQEAGARAALHARPRTLVACPLMHGTGLMSTIAALNAGGAACYLPSAKFNVTELLDEAVRLRTARISLVGMAFAGPLLEALDAEPGRWDLPDLRNINSSGAMWSIENKRGLLRHLPQITLTDTFASSEGFQMATSHSSVETLSETARFAIGPNCAVFTEDGRRIVPGSGERGLAAVSGHIPLGYYNDPAKTARTFPIIEGRRWSMPGDWASVEADGTLVLLGRGSQCINAGGEKVFPEEVEEVLKRHPAIRDAAVIGLPDPRFGEHICAVVELRRGADDPGLDAVAAHTRDHLAAYKAPRSLVVTGNINRQPNGKLDYRAIRELAEAATRISA